MGKDSKAFHVMLFESKERCEGLMQRNGGSSLLGAAELAPLGSALALRSDYLGREKAGNSGPVRHGRP